MAPSRRCTQDSCCSGGAEVCWICLEEGSAEAPLMQQCGCPRKAHRPCVARWQIQQAGRAEETQCRFCKQALPDWSEELLPASVRDVAPTAIMAVVYNGQYYKVPVRPGPDGEAEFKATVKTLFNFPMDLDFDVTFEVKLPSVPGHSLPATGSDTNLVLKGLKQFGAAATCAQASAVARALATSESGAAGSSAASSSSRAVSSSGAAGGGEQQSPQPRVRPDAARQ